ncbi:unnamed protein product [Urochloa humidicola]
MGNKGTFVRFTAPEMKPDIVTFSAMLAGIEYMEQVEAPSPGRSPNEKEGIGSQLHSRQVLHVLTALIFILEQISVSSTFFTTSFYI